MSHPYLIEYLKAWPVSAAALTVADFLVACLLALRYYDRLDGLWAFAVWFWFCLSSLLKFLLIHGFLDVNFRVLDFRIVDS